MTLARIPKRSLKRILARVLVPLACAVAVSCQAQTGTSALPAANPARPTVTNPATLAPLGYLQFEQGYLASVNSPNTKSQYGVNQVTKLTVHPRLMLELQTQPFAVSRVDGTPGTSQEAGDIDIGGQFVLWSPPDTSDADIAKDVHRHAYVRSALPTIAFTYLQRVHAGTTPDIDVGGFSRSALFLFSGHAPGIDFHYDINLIANQQEGDSNLISGSTIRRGQFGQTFSLDRPIFNPNLQISIEIYHFTQPFVAATATGLPVGRANQVGFLFAPSYQLRPNLVFDGGFERGLTSTSTHWQSFAGFTYLLPHRLWPDHHKQS